MHKKNVLYLCIISIVLKCIEVFCVRSLSAWECFEMTSFSLNLLLLEQNDYLKQCAHHYEQILENDPLFLFSICHMSKMM